MFRVLLLCGLLFAVGVSAQNCTAATAVLTQDVPEWTYVKVRSQFAGSISIVNGGDIPNTQIIANVYAATQDEADRVIIASYFPDVEGGLVFIISNNVTFDAPPIGEAEEYAQEESSGSRASSSVALALGATVYAATRNAGAALASIPISYIFSSSVAEAQCQVTVHVVVKVPSEVVTATGLSVPSFGTLNSTSGEIVWAFGIVDISNCSNCAGNYPCTFQSRSGQCQDVSTCRKTSVPRLCPGPANIQCCVDVPAQSNPGGGSVSVNPRQTASVPFARVAGSHWPLKQSTRSTICYDDANGSNDRQVPTSPIASNFGCNTRKFFAQRSGGRYHSGIDLYAPAKTQVVAVASGTVVNTYSFFENVCCVIVQSDYGEVHNYGEISCNYVVRNRQRVSAGQLIGYVGELRCCHPMLHFETYRQGTTVNQRSFVNNINRAVLNPTRLLLHLRQNGQ